MRDRERFLGARECFLDIRIKGEREGFQSVREPFLGEGDNFWVA